MVDLVDCKSYQNIQLFAHKEIYSLTNNSKKHTSIFSNVRKDNKHIQIALKQSNYKTIFAQKFYFECIFLFAWEYYLKKC